MSLTRVFWILLLGLTLGSGSKSRDLGSLEIRRLSVTAGFNVAEPDAVQVIASLGYAQVGDECPDRNRSAPRAGRRAGEARTLTSNRALIRSGQARTAGNNVDVSVPELAAGRWSVELGAAAAASVASCHHADECVATIAGKGALAFQMA